MSAPQYAANQAAIADEARRRRYVFRGLVILFGLMMIFIPGAGFLDLPSIIPAAGFANQGPFDAAHGIVTVVLVGAAFLAQARAPKVKVAGLQQAAVMVAAVALSALAGLDFATLLSACVLAALVAVLLPLHPARRQFLARGRLSLPMASLAVAGALPLMVYALAMAARTRAHLLPYPGSIPTEEGPNDWLNFTAVAMGIGFVAVLAALRTQGWRIPAWSAAVASLLLAVSWILHPGKAGSEPLVAAGLLIVWGVVLLATSEWESRRDGATVT